MTHPVEFRWTQGGNHVLVAGSFSDWKGVPLTRDKAGNHTVTLRLRPGAHLYKYIVDGFWFYDLTQRHIKDSHGSDNNVIVTGSGSVSASGSGSVSSHKRPKVGEKLKPLQKRKFVAKHGAVSPVASLIVNHYRNDKSFKWETEDSAQEAELTFADGEPTIYGDLEIAKYLAKLNPESGLSGADKGEASEVDEWISESQKLQGASEATFLELIGNMNVHLKLKTYFVGHALTLADISLWIALCRAHSFWSSIEGTNKSVKYKFLVRWFRFLDTGYFREVKTLIPQESSEGISAGTFDELPGAVKGKVRVRFPPEPSGYLHIGHAKAAFINEYYAKKYDGQLIVRFDDTNPTKEKEEYEEAILKDLDVLGIKPSVISYTSDYFGQILQKAEEMIKLNRAFCCDLSDDEMSEYRDIKKGLKPSPNRDNPVGKNLQIWEEMKKASEIGKKYALRAKIDYNSENGTLRDPVIYRVIDEHHNRTKDKFKVYPIYNFACPIVDSLEGVTHALRSNEYHSSEEQYYWFLQNIPGLSKVTIFDFGRVNFTYTLLSKRKLNHFVNEGLVESWSDPRFPTLRGVLRRGLRVESLKKYIYSQGVSKRTNCMDIHQLWALNKQYIDKIIPRYTAVRKENIVVVELDGPKSPEKATVPRHRQKPELGTKVITRCNKVFIEQEDAQSLKEKEEITLMDWGNVIITHIGKSGDKVTRIQAKLNLDGDYKSTEKKLTWLPAEPHNLLEVILIEYDTLITEKSIPKGEKDWTKYINPNTKFETIAYADPNLRSLKQHDQFQFERIGYYVLDSDPTEEKLKFVQTPDGHLTNKFLSKKVEERH
jgi:glutamyl-tRNA synthetase